MSTSWANVPVMVAGVAAALGVVALFGLLATLLKRYRLRYTSSTESGLGDVFLFISPAQVWQLSMGICVLVGGLVWMTTHAAGLAAVAVAVCLRLPTIVIAHLRKKRVTAVETLLPESLRTMAGGLRAGASLPAVIRHMTLHADNPLRQELELVLREQRVGVSFVEAMQHMENRLHSEPVSLLCASLRVAAQTGGNLSETIDSVTSTIERRMQMAARIRTLTAQGRMQAVVVGALPALLLCALTVIVPDDMAPLWHTRAGWIVLGVMAVMQMCGFLIIRQIVRVDI